MPRNLFRLTTATLLLSLAFLPSRAQEVGTRPAPEVGTRPAPEVGTRPAPEVGTRPALNVASPTQPSGTPLHIALVVPLSGSGKTIGSELEFGSSLAVNQARAEFKGLGFDLSLVRFDDQMSSNVARRAARAIVADAHTLVAIGALDSEVTLSVAQQFRQGAVLPSHADTTPLIVPSPVDIALTGPDYSNVSRILARNDGIALAAGQYLQKALRAGRVLMVDDKTDAGHDSTISIGNYLKSNHVPVVGEISTLETVNFSKTLEQVRKLKPDALALGFASPVSSARLVGQLRAAGVKVPIMGTITFADPTFIKLTAQNTLGLYYASFAAPISGAKQNTLLKSQSDAFSAYASPEMPGFVQAYQALAHRPPTPYSVLGHDAARVALEGLRGTLKTAGGKLPTRAEVARSLRKVNLTDTLSGPMRFNRAGDLLETHAYVLRFNSNLEAKLVSIVSVQGDPN